jgi:probable LLM family oxidoreductase
MEIGITTFGETTPDPLTGRTVDSATRLADLLEEIQLADELGLDVFAVGEHHRPDFAVSSPAVVLGAAAAITHQIRLASAVTVLSTDDPVRVFQDFATVDLLSNGRAEIWAGRGSFTESYPLFGYDLADYDELYAEKLDLLLKVRENEQVTWEGKHRAPIVDRGIYPRPVQDPLPVWIGVGGNPGSVIRAGRLGLPLVLAIIGGTPDRFVPLIDLYRASADDAGNQPSTRVAINSHGFIAENSQDAVDTFYPPYAQVMTRIGRERGWSPMTREGFDAMRAPGGSLLIGSPQEVIDKMLREFELFKYDRFLLHLSVGTMPHKQVMRSIELLGTEVAPVIRKETAVPPGILAATLAQVAHSQA